MAVTASAITGSALNVPWASRADHLVGVARVSGGLSVYLASKASIKVKADHNIARDPRDCVSFDGTVEVTAAPAEFTSETVALYGAMVRSAQMAGALERIIEDTLQYTTDRTQFGKPIGKFQVIQQNMAMAAAEVAAAVMAAQNAFRAAEQGPPDFEAACKVLAGEAPGWRPIFATKRTVQLGSLMSITCISLREGFGLGGGVRCRIQVGRAARPTRCCPWGGCSLVGHYGEAVHQRLKGGMLDEGQKRSRYRVHARNWGGCRRSARGGRLQCDAQRFWRDGGD